MIPVLLLVLLLAMPDVSVQGASNGLLLWFHVVLPTLAPFMICTQFVTRFGGMELLMRPCAPLFRRIFRLDPAGGYVLLCGLLCGYPLGAKLCADFKRQGRITEKEAAYLLSICNHPSPMFLLGYVRNQFSFSVSGCLLFLCLYFPILPISFLSRRFYQMKTEDAANFGIHSKPVSQSLDEILMSVCDTLVLIGGYIMLFSILTAWIGRLPYLSVRTKALLSAAAEITTGIHQITASKAFAFPLLPVVAAVSFGGLSGLFQTRSVLTRTITEESCADAENRKNAGLSIRHYLLWKLLHMTISCITLVLLQLLPL